MIKRLSLFGCTLILLMNAGGCVERILTVQSNPPGALVELNGNEMGRTPVSRDFTWYGWYDVTVRKPGYQTLKVTAPVIAPFYEWVPFDFVSELLPIPLKYHKTLSYTLKPMPEGSEDAQNLLQRSNQLKSELQGTGSPPKSRKAKASTKSVTESSAQSPAVSEPVSSEPVSTGPASTGPANSESVDNAPSEMPQAPVTQPTSMP